MSNNNPTYKNLYQYFPVVDVTAKRALDKDIALDLGYRIMRLRELYEATDRRRQDLLEDHAERDDEGKVVKVEPTDVDGGPGPMQIKVRDQLAFDKAWRDMLDAPIEGYPEWPKKIDPLKLPDDVTAFEVEALLRLRLIDKPDVF